MDEKLPVITITRDLMTSEATLGRLRVNGFECVTLELPWRDNAEDVSCIPPGTYKARITYSNKFKRALPELLDVPGRSKVRIHAGNTTRDTQGCVLVGEERVDSAPMITKSQVTLTELFDALHPAKAFWVNIREREA